MLFTPLIYLAGFLLTLLSLVVWFYYRRNDDAAVWFQRLVYIGLALYLGGLFLNPSGMEFKVGSLVRDLTIIGGVGLLFNFLVRKRPAYFFGLIALLTVLFWYYNHYLKPTARAFWATPQSSQLIELDPEGELLLELTTPEVEGELRAALFMRNLRIEPAFTMEQPELTELDNYFVVDVPGNAHRQETIDRLITDLQQIPGVEWIEPNEVINLDDPSMGELPTRLPDEVRAKYGINDPGLEELWAFEAMGMDKLFTYLRDQKLKPKRKAIVAILDTGVDAKHEDIESNFKSFAGKHDKDPHRHGTHCAGIAGSVSDNGKGVASFSHDNAFVEISSVRVLSPIGSGTQRSIINGMLEAADKGADVISMSLGGRSTQSAQRAYEKAVAYANKANAIVVAAAGNANRNARDFSPVNVKGVLGVSAVDANLNRAVFSNTVQDIEMAVAAPGVDILSTIPGDKYAKFSGTSMATPYVAGLAGLLKSLRPELTTEELHLILQSSGKDTGSPRETGRLIQPVEAVKAVISSKPKGSFWLSTPIGTYRLPDLD